MNKNSNRRKVGILGGTFNPVHNGHIQLGQNIRDAFQLDEILYILSANPPHKKTPDIVTPEIRWQMLTRALAPYPYLVPCDLEMKRPNDSWTIVTIEQLKRIRPNDHFYFLSGSEGFLKIRTWKDYKRLLHALTFIVLIREESHRSKVRQLLSEEGIQPLDWPLENHDQSNERDLDEMVNAYLYVYRSPLIHLSSTLIRGKIRASESIEGFVDPEVKKILEEKKLYEKRSI